MPSHRSAASKGREPFGWREGSVVVRISVCIRKWPIAPGGVNQMAVPTGDNLEGSCGSLAEGQAGSISKIPWLIASPGRSTLDRCAGSSGKG
ncbi:hypothetical protein BHE90_016241 [Fusarium euwallaceae]|uniref:Uncharacterized protein n=3 Tax=Fusarium solani species complex TaxID=232080 RepID=A0A3M2RBL9_9HYPO|nr:hypothetical protein CDV36_015294 [Fusarium kuroshium]RSM08275.1 hypothetical protein CEP52_004781 [Fusarium oligoseptatum]RTE69380.1 hypothetical protein BHE90_016241 [Fusarium euwallaceae]